MEAAAKRDNLILQVADAIRKKCIDPYGGFPYVSFSVTCYRRHVRDNLIFDMTTELKQLSRGNIVDLARLRSAVRSPSS